MNKFLIAMFLVLAVLGFTMSSVSAQGHYTNVLELNKPYSIDGNGHSLNPSANPGITMSGWDVSFDIYYGKDTSEHNVIWEDYRSTRNGFDLRTNGIVKLTKKVSYSEDYLTLRAVKVGEYDTKTKHWFGDNNYHWIIVDTSYRD